MTHLGIVAALPGEFGPLVQGWRPIALPASSKGDTVWAGRIGAVECMAVAAGMGKNAARRACDIAASVAAREGSHLQGLVSVGWAGALSCGLSAGCAYWAAEVVDAASGERFVTGFAPGPGARLTLVTIDHVAQPVEKRHLAERHHAVLVDMEAATVARIASANGIEFYCLKAVSDSPGEVLPDFSRFIDAQGKMRMFRFLAHVSIRPKHWRPMARISKNGKIGARALAASLREFISEGKNADDRNR